MQRRMLGLGAVVLSTGCGASPVSVVHAPVASGAPAPHAIESLRVPAVAREPMPTCRAGEMGALATLTEGVPAHVAIGARDTGAVVAYVTDANHDGHTELMLLTLDSHGAPVGVPTALAGVTDPDFPALVARGVGYVLAFREGAPGHQSIGLRDLDARGAVRAELPSAHAGGWLGAPALAVEATHVWTAVVSSTDGATWDGVFVSEPGVNVPVRIAGGGLDAERPPSIVVPPAQGGTRVWVAAHDAEGGAVYEVRTDRLQATAVRRLRDAEAPTASYGMLAWRVPVSRHDVAIRVWPDRGTVQAPPWTVATYEGAFDPEVQLLPIDADAVGAFTVSTLSDDASGALNMSALGVDGSYLGRQPLIASSVLRNARVVGARAGASLWFVIEGRADTSATPVLGLLPVTCDHEHPADPLQIPPAGLVQRMADLDDAPVQLRAPTPPSACSSTVAAVPFAHHVSRADDALSGTSVQTVPLAGQRTLLFAAVNDTAHGAHLVATTVDPHGALGATATLADVDELLTAAPFAHGAVGVANGAARSLLVHVDGAAHVTRTDLALGRASSATVSGASVFMVAPGPDGAADSVSLWLVHAAGGRPTRLVHLRPGDTVLDAMRTPHGTELLLARPSRVRGSTVRALAHLLVPDRGSSAGLPIDPFADPLGYGDGLAWWTGGATATPTVVYAVHDVLRAADLDRGQLRASRSVARVHPSGGALIAAGAPNGSTRWGVLSTGLPASASDRPADLSPLTLVAMGPRGEVTVIDASLPNDRAAIAGHAALSVQGDHVTLAYARLDDNGQIEWRAAQATCTVSTGRAGGAR